MRSDGQDDSFMVKWVSWRPEGRVVEAAIVVEEVPDEEEDEILEVLEEEEGKGGTALGVEAGKEEAVAPELGAAEGLEAGGLGLEEELMMKEKKAREERGKK